VSGSDDVVTVSRLVFNDSSCDKVLCPSVRLSVCHTVTRYWEVLGLRCLNAADDDDEPNLTSVSMHGKPPASDAGA